MENKTIAGRILCVVSCLHFAMLRVCNQSPGHRDARLSCYSSNTYRTHLSHSFVSNVICPLEFGTARKGTDTYAPFDAFIANKSFSLSSPNWPICHLKVSYTVWPLVARIWMKPLKLIAKASKNRRSVMLVRSWRLRIASIVWGAILRRLWTSISSR